VASYDYDLLIVGSGFGGSVAALRAAEKGYRVGVMESGRRWPDEDIPKTQWDLPHFIWMPATVNAECGILYFGGQGVGPDILKLLVWTAVIVVLLMLPASRRLERRRESAVAPGALAPPAPTVLREA
jgi:hypothetical protein